MAKEINCKSKTSSSHARNARHMLDTHRKDSKSRGLRNFHGRILFWLLGRISIWTRLVALALTPTSPLAILLALVPRIPRLIPSVLLCLSPTTALPLAAGLRLEIPIDGTGSIA